MRIRRSFSNTRPASAALLILAAVLAAYAGNHNAYPGPEERGTAGILASLEKLPVFVRVLQITAHPDDEGAATLTWLSRKAHARTALFSLTRGDGGQNVLGDEKYEAMGLLRTGELLEAARIYGVETYFSTVFEFGFSKSAEETLAKWGHEATLEELVRFIRAWRPTVILSRFQGNARDGHGHHQAAGLLSREAFRAAADPKRFPEHFTRGLQPWQTRKLYLPGNRPGGAAGTGPAEWTVEIPVGEYDPVLGRSYREIGSEGYSKHRSQGNASSFSPPGPSFDYYTLTESSVGRPARERTLFDSLDTTVVSIAELAGGESGKAPFLQNDLGEILRAARGALAAFDLKRPAASAPEAARGAALVTNLIRKVESSGLSQPIQSAIKDALVEKQQDFNDAVHATLGIYLATRAEEATVVPGQKLDVGVSFHVRGTEAVELQQLSLRVPEGWSSVRTAEPPLGKIQAPGAAVVDFSVAVSPEAGATEPFWFRARPDDSRYSLRPTSNPFAPFDPPLVEARATYRFLDHEFSIDAPVRAQVNDPLRGVDFRDLQVVPALSLSLSPAQAVVPITGVEQVRELEVVVLSNLGAAAKGQVSLSAPPGWRVDPPAADFTIAGKGESYSRRFKVNIPPDVNAGRAVIEAVSRWNEQEYRRGYRVVSYPENWTRHLYAPARSEVQIFEVKLAPGLTVGYVPGAGDEVAESLAQLGVQARSLTSDDLAFGDLGRFQAIVTGIRAYNINQGLKANNRRLLSYVEAGGTLIVQYNTPERSPGRGGRGAAGARGSPFPYGPFPMSNSTSERITVESSPISILDPDHPLLNHPNRITQSDFEGWVQERGLYFMSEWDARYVPLLAGNDPGEEPLKGGMLVARYGKGHYIFTAYAWFRQLPAGVPGAYRIFANMLSAGSRP